MRAEQVLGQVLAHTHTQKARRMGAGCCCGGGGCVLTQAVGCKRANPSWNMH
jgi:hypothetical protein